MLENLLDMANKSIRLTIPFPSKITANLFFDVLNVDNEPKRSEVTKNISVDGDNYFTWKGLQKATCFCEWCLKEYSINIQNSRFIQKLRKMPEHTPAPTPARSLYGFFMYLFSKTVLIVYCIWAFIPDYYLHMLNIDYYPIKYWATAVPIQCLVALTIFAFIIYPSSNMILTPNIDSINTITDSYSNYKCEVTKKCPITTSCICTDVSNCYKNCFNSMPDCDDSVVPQLHDLDIRFVSEKLYFNKNMN